MIRAGEDWSSMSAVDSYRIKRVRFFGRKVPILCQNENGPCPLLAIANVLLLQSNISIHPDVSEISFSELTQLVAGFLLDSNPPHEDSRISVNQQTQLDAVIKLLPRLQYGLDVNVRFNNVRGFEFTEEMAAFDMTGITLLHGWILDPEDKRTGKVIEGLSYNKLVEKLLEFRSTTAVEPSAQSEQGLDIAGIGSTVTSGIAASSDHQAEVTHVATTAEEAPVGPAPEAQDAAVVGGDAYAPVGEGGASSPSTASNQDGPDSMLHRVVPPSDNVVAQATSGGIANTDSAEVATALREGQVAEEFFRDTASQLTYYGLAQLYQEVRERQLCVFFRNNHFSTMFKYEGKLYLLITDLGYARESSVVWEKLDQIDGNTEYADSEFCRSSRCGLAGGVPSGEVQNADPDYMLALALQQEDESALESTSPNPSNVLGDEAVAMALFGQDERAPVEQRLGGSTADAPLAAAGHGTDQDRQRPAESARGNRSENGSSCSIQ